MSERQSATAREIEYADRLADHLREVFDREPDPEGLGICDVDVLDGLATAGLILVPDEAGLASAAYAERISDAYDAILRKLRQP